MTSPSVLVVRSDNVGDVLLMGPAVRAVAASGAEVTFLAGPTGAVAARLLPGITEVLVHHAAWIDADPEPVDADGTLAMIDELRRRAFDQALIFTSFHQSPLPMALLLRMAGIPTVAAISVDYPGSLLDVRHHVDDDIHEVERALSLVGTLGYTLPADDDRGLALRPGAGVAERSPITTPYIVVHPGASVPARAWAPERTTGLVAALRRAGHRVVVTGGRGEVVLTARVAGPPDAGVIDLGGRTDLEGLADVVAAADAVVVGNTGAAHLAAAVGTPVVSLFAPTVPASRWRPWGVAHALLGHQDISCAGCRARVCPVPGHPCIDTVEVADVVDAVTAVARRSVEAVAS